MERQLLIQKEQAMVTWMINYYCNKNHGGKNLCRDCAKLINYANARTAACPFIEVKSFCSNCPVHCYKPEMREKIRKVMRYAAPRMLFHHPILALKHVTATIKHKILKESRK